MNIMINKIKLLSLAYLFLVMPEVFAAVTLTGTQKSFEQAFESLLKSDAAVAEEWDIEIGKKIKTHPTNFLKTLKRYRNKVTRLDALLGNLGPEFVDDFSRQKIELQKRIQSLGSVNSGTLRPVRKECIEELKKQIKDISGTVD